ncbi:hypothetical protein U8C39_16875 [Sinorhizobium meliloti]|nr:hypothetical protein U8C39_16875 [Sinorhizobium meliloti]
MRLRLRVPRTEIQRRPELERLEGLTQQEALYLVIDILENGELQPELPLQALSKQDLSDRLQRLVPVQKLAPVQFEFRDEKLAVQHTPARADAEDASNAHSARLALIEQGNRLVQDIKQTNCDRRFLDNIQELQTKLETIQDIIQLGIVNQRCEELRKQFEAELPDVVAAGLRSHLSSVGMYLAQFPDWLRFTENAASVELDEADIRRSKEVANEIVLRFEKMAESVDAEVPKTIKLINDAIADPRNTSRRAAYALLVTLENLVGLLMRQSTHAMGELVSETAKKVVGPISRVLAITLTTVVVGWIGQLLPVYAKLPDALWLKKAIEVYELLK